APHPTPHDPRPARVSLYTLRARPRNLCMPQPTPSPHAQTGRTLGWVLAAVALLVVATGCGFGLLHLFRLSAQNMTTDGVAPIDTTPRPPDCVITISHPDTL